MEGENTKREHFLAFSENRMEFFEEALLENHAEPELLTRFCSNRG